MARLSNQVVDERIYESANTEIQGGVEVRL